MKADKSLLRIESSSTVPHRDTTAAVCEHSQQSRATLGYGCLQDVGCCSMVPDGSRRGALGFPLHPSQLKAYLCLIYSESDRVDSCSGGRLEKTLEFEIEIRKKQT